MVSIETKELYIKSKVYGGIAFVFFLIGFAVFLFLYIENSGGNILEALRDPAIIIMVLFPFLPAVVFSFMASSAEKKSRALLERDKNKS